MNSLYTIGISLILFFAAAITVKAQDVIDDLVKEQKKGTKEYVFATFKSTRLIHGHTVEMTKKNALDFRIAHRFGNIASSPNDHIHNMFGFDQATDILFSFDYGILQDLSVGAGRAKGNGALNELWYGNIKYRPLKQTTDFRHPMTITLLAQTAISSQRRQNNSPELIASFPKWYHRMSYVVQAQLAVKATSWLSIQLSPGFLWRNLVTPDDKNGLFTLGLLSRAKVSKRSAIVFEYFLPITREGATYREYFPMLRGVKDAGYYPGIHIGYEIETGGHVFQINLTNTAGLLENDFLAYNPHNWAQGQFRLGFTIARTFQFGKDINPWTGRYTRKKLLRDMQAKKGE
ncbi:MAG: DUF5777 family beta-barrel protein [Chitinophagales bacterium]|nr:DUF5777 family beta-barrel protein [Chitinophagales bacterium]MDW8272786.1 DUF5777 family beta-barrel protein [Chitinophagales bacterium]